MRDLAALVVWFLLACSAVSAHPWEPLTSLTILTKSETLVTGGMGGEILWRDLKTGEVLYRWAVTDKGPVVGLHAQSAGPGVVATFVGGTSVVLAPAQPDPVVQKSPDPQSQREIQRWRREGPAMSGVRAENGPVVALGSPDGTIRLQDADGKPTLAWKAHAAAVTGLAWSSDGLLLYSCSFDGGVAVWAAQTGELKSRL